MSGAFFFIIFLVVVGFIIRHLVKKTKRRVAEWSLAAQSLGLDYTSAGMPFQTGSIHGECQGVWISVALHSERSGKSSTTYTRYVTQYPERLPLELRLTRQGFFHDVASFFGVQDIEVGDPDFDALVIIKGDDKVAVREFLTTELRQEISSLYAAFERVSIDSGQIVALAHGVTDRHQTLVDAVESLVGAARVISGAGARPVQTVRAHGQRVRLVSEDHPEEPDDLISQVRNSWAQGKSFLGAPLMGAGSNRHEVFEPYQPPQPTWESERATDPGVGVEPAQPEENEIEAAAETAEAAVEELDTAAVFSGLSDTARAFDELEHDSALQAVDETAVQSPPPLETGEPADRSSATVLCETLFGGNASGYEIDQRFTAYAGAKVAWNGTLREAQGYDLDFELGSGSGTRAVFEVHQVTSALGIAEMITAVVKFPEGYEQRLGELVGECVAFEGRLEKVKGLMKELIVLDGELIS
ncbi:MAG: hypothetical protein JRF63_00450 [Deltaproteobacteria bacterium]|nr:hypothetical protein [Deltaproteobacteria bacterium]